MALPSWAWLLLHLLLMATPLPGSCEKIARTGTDSFLIKCYDPEPALTDAANGTAFRANLLRILRTVPSAAAPTGFASLNSTGRGRAFAPALCFGESTVPSECQGCVSVAARSLISGCSTTTRRAGIWTDSCFVAYADTDHSTPSEDAFRSRVLLGGHVAVPVPADPTNYSQYLHARVLAWTQLVVDLAVLNISGTRMVATKDDTIDEGWPVTVRSTVHVLAQCPGRARAAAAGLERGHTEADCSLCLMESAKAVDWELDAARGDGGVAAAVVGFNCYLRFEVSSSLLSENADMFAYTVIAGLVAALAVFVPLALAILRNLQ